MSYNLQTLITILEAILDPQRTRWILDHNKPQLESFLKTVVSLQKTLDNTSIPKIESLESQIRDASHKAEDIIELQMVDQMLSSPEGLSFTFSTPDLQQVAQELDSAMAQVAELMKGNEMSTRKNSSIGASSFSSLKSVVVGVDGDLMQLKDRLLGTKSKLEIIPIVGMGGVGKTTLARKLYEDPLILSHFRYLAWTTISQDYDIEAILLGLLRCIIGNDQSDEYIGMKSDDLKDVLHKSLFGRKYMIVLDDVWSTEFWDVIRKYFPDNDNGSRIVITTRELNVANYADSQSTHHEVKLLSESDSWNLLRQMVFGEEDCPEDLQVIGTKIACDCGGLPLAINVIGGLLSKMGRSQDVWEDIGKDVRAAIAESDKNFSQILYLSYNHLPNHLKPCFLYMGGFPEDYEHKISNLIHMWIGEGFVKKNGDRSLEEEAEDYLKALAERNLVLVDYSINGKPKRCNIHDLLRDVCIEKAEEDKFLHIWSDPKINTCSNLRRVSVPTPYKFGDVSAASAEFISLSRSFLYTGSSCRDRELEYVPFSALRLLRVLNVSDINFQEFPQVILRLVGLRYLALGECDEIPIGISRLCNLQTLITAVRKTDVPSELLEMCELRYISFIYRAVAMRDDYMKRVTLEKLERIYYVALDQFVIGRGLFENFPNVKNLGIWFSSDYRSTDSNGHGAVNLSQLHKLETLRCNSRSYRTGRCHLGAVTFPFSLRNLTLKYCKLSPTILTTLCALPKLEALKMRRCVFESEETYEEWEATEGDVFVSLKYLKLDNLELKSWRADETNFPRLGHLYLRGCYFLEEIPSAIGEISALQLIEIRQCSESVVASAKKIQEVQQSELEDYTLKLRIYQ